MKMDRSIFFLLVFSLVSIETNAVVIPREYTTPLKGNFEHAASLSRTGAQCPSRVSLDTDEAVPKIDGVSCRGFASSHLADEKYTRLETAVQEIVTPVVANPYIVAKMLEFFGEHSKNNFGKGDDNMPFVAKILRSKHSCGTHEFPAGTVHFYTKASQSNGILAIARKNHICLYLQREGSEENANIESAEEPLVNYPSLLRRLFSLRQAALTPDETQIPTWEAGIVPPLASAPASLGPAALFASPRPSPTANPDITTITLTAPRADIMENDIDIVSETPHFMAPMGALPKLAEPILDGDFPYPLFASETPSTSIALSMSPASNFTTPEKIDIDIIPAHAARQAVSASAAPSIPSFVGISFNSAPHATLYAVSASPTASPSASLTTSPTPTPSPSPTIFSSVAGSSSLSTAAINSKTAASPAASIPSFVGISFNSTPHATLLAVSASPTGSPSASITTSPTPTPTIFNSGSSSLSTAAINSNFAASTVPSIPSFVGISFNSAPHATLHAVSASPAAPSPSASHTSMPAAPSSSPSPSNSNAAIAIAAVSVPTLPSFPVISFNSAPHATLHAVSVSPSAPAPSASHTSMPVAPSSTPTASKAVLKIAATTFSTSPVPGLPSFQAISFDSQPYATLHAVSASPSNTPTPVPSKTSAPSAPLTVQSTAVAASPKPNTPTPSTSSKPTSATKQAPSPAPNTSSSHTPVPSIPNFAATAASKSPAPVSKSPKPLSNTPKPSTPAKTPSLDIQAASSPTSSAPASTASRTPMPSIFRPAASTAPKLSVPAPTASHTPMPSIFRPAASPTPTSSVPAPTASHTPVPSIPKPAKPSQSKKSKPTPAPSKAPSNIPTVLIGTPWPTPTHSVAPTIRPPIVIEPVVITAPSTAPAYSKKAAKSSISPPIRGTVWPKKSTVPGVTPSTSKVYVRGTVWPKTSTGPSVSAVPTPSTSRIYIRGTIWPKSASPSAGILDTASVPTPSANVSASASPQILGPVQNRTNNGSVCFPSGATVRLSDGQNVRMENVEIGMRVLVAGGQYSEVYGFSHNKPDVWYNFVKISTADGELRLTHSHHVYTADGVFAAEMLKVGDELILGKTGASSRILRIGSSIEYGLYNPHTVSGSIVVDGFQTSTYTSHFDGSASQAALAPLRTAFKCGSNWDALGRLLQYGLYDIGQLIASNL